VFEGPVRNTIVYDMTRLLIGPILSSPRGVDRFDFLVARHYSQHAHDRFLGFLPTPWGMRVYEADRVQRLLSRLEELWAENTDPAEDVVFREIVGALASGRSRGPGRPVKARGFRRKGQRIASLIGSTGFSFGRSAIESVPKNAVYLNIAQTSPAVPQFLGWLNRRRDVKPVFMLHDVIPLERPDYVSRTNARVHRTMVRSIARYASGLIVTTAHARETVLRALAAEGRSGMRTLGVTLPLAEAFDAPVEPEPRLQDIPYFVVCGAIEPHKNHLLLSEVWRRLCQSPEAAPHLVVIGIPWWRGKPILAEMFSSAETRGKIHHAAGLSTPAMKRLIAGSLGVLAPSLDEGFGLTILEALHLGAPVVASDIPPHREVAAGRATLLDPTDAAAWARAVISLSSGRRDGERVARSAANARTGRLEVLDAISEFLETF
jgi:glycosyltransferase involved in cell wall biosynthesis